MLYIPALIKQESLIIELQLENLRVNEKHTYKKVEIIN